MKNGFRWQRALAIARKEVFHILRDPFTLLLALAWPVVVVVIFGFAMDFNIKEIPLSVYDADRTQASRLLQRTFDSSQYFRSFQVSSPQEAIARIEGEQARAALIIPPYFQSDLWAGKSTEVQILVDGSDNSTVGSMTNYIGRIQKLASEKLTGTVIRDPVDLKVRFLFNPELNSRWFIIPGLAVVVMSILSILLTALTVAREWENGSMELLLSTPVRPLEIVLGKLTPYGILGLGAVFLVYSVARLGFGVPFVGNHLIFLLGCLLFLLCYLAQGLLISVITRKQQLAMQLGMMTGLLPAQLLSGFVFPVESMPLFFQYFTSILPARWFTEITRREFLEAATLWDLVTPFGIMTLILFILVRLAAKKFKKDLEP